MSIPCEGDINNINTNAKSSGSMILAGGTISLAEQPHNWQEGDIVSFDEYSISIFMSGNIVTVPYCEQVSIFLSAYKKLVKYCIETNKDMTTVISNAIMMYLNEQ